MQIRQWMRFVGVVAMLAACGDDDEQPASQPATVNKQAAASNAQTTIAALSTTLSGSDSSASAGSLSSVAQSSQSLLQASPGTAKSGLSLDEMGAVRPLELGGPGCTCTATGCTFTNCSPTSGSTSESQYSFTIDGSYSWGGGHIECKDLKYTFKGSNSGASIGFSTNVAVTLNCDITITSTSIKGFVQSAGSSSTEIAGQKTQGAYSSSWNVKSTYNEVTFGADHQPTGGSLHVEGTTSVTAAGTTQNFAGSADVSFPVK